MDCKETILRSGSLHQKPFNPDRDQQQLSLFLLQPRTLFNWAYDHELTRNRPFKHFKVKECVYGPPIFTTIDERNKVYATDFSFDPALEKQRDIFVFQCLVGCRISDLYRMTKNSIIDGCVEYMPRKTKDGRPVVVRVPMLPVTKEILDKYKDLPDDAILLQASRSSARFTRCCHLTVQERRSLAICMTRYKTLTLYVPSPVTKRAAKPSTATARLTRRPTVRPSRCWSRDRVKY